MMKPRTIRPGIQWMGAVDWNRRLFDALIPLPDGTSYNAYLVQGEQKTALLDTVDPSKTEWLLSQLENVPRLDYIIAQHAEQDHSGAIPLLLEKYPDAQVLCSARAKTMLVDLLYIAEERIRPLADGDTLCLGGRTLQFISAPWVHWPETMLTYLQEEHILFSCDFFGSHIAGTDLYVEDEAAVFEAAKRYYAEIMMPFRKVIKRHLDKLGSMQLDLIAPSHGPIYRNPARILDAYREWTAGEPHNLVVLPYVSMHGSTARLVDHLAAALCERDVSVQLFDLTVSDTGRLAMALVDAATLVLGASTVHAGPHPLAVYAASLVNALRPKFRFASVIGSYGWGERSVSGIARLIPNLKVEMLEAVVCKGAPRPQHFMQLDQLADTIAARHRQMVSERTQL